LRTWRPAEQAPVSRAGYDLTFITEPGAHPAAGELIVGLLREAGLEATVRNDEPLVVAFRSQGLS
jgi:hypothetical protein